MLVAEITGAISIGANWDSKCARRSAVGSCAGAEEVASSPLSEVPEALGLGEGDRGFLEGRDLEVAEEVGLRFSDLVGAAGIVTDVVE